MRLALSILVPLVLFLAVGWVVRARGIRLPARVDAALDSRWAPAVMGLLTAAVVLFVWRSANQPAAVHDEQAYVFQARVFATGHWTGVVPPVPEFFEQVHVFVSPTLAAKYPPGHSLLLVPGVWLGLVGLMPLVLNAVAGALLFAIIRRVTDPALALLTWALWATSATSLLWRASYYSQNASTALWLLSLWALLRWRSGGRRPLVVLVIGALGWMYITRPLSTPGLAVPIVALVLFTAWHRRLLNQVVLSSVVLLPILLLNFLWQERTLGQWLTSPYAEYSRQYFPFVKPGFGVDPTPPLRQPPPEITWLGQAFVSYHAAHIPAALPAILLQRITAFLFIVGQPWRAFLIPLFLLGAIRTSAPARLSAASFLLFFGAYLIYAHPPWWTLYYAEVMPGFFFIAMFEMMRIGRTALKLDDPRLRAALLLALVLMSPWMIRDVLAARAAVDERLGFHRQAAKTLTTIPEPSAVVFVHYDPSHSHHVSLILNTPDYRTAPLWLVYDRGADNQRLLGVTDRPAYRLHTDTWVLERVR